MLCNCAHEQISRLSFDKVSICDFIHKPTVLCVGMDVASNVVHRQTPTYLQQPICAVYLYNTIPVDCILHITSTSSLYSSETCVTDTSSYDLVFITNNRYAYIIRLITMNFTDSISLF
jgi:hypothetical protein